MELKLMSVKETAQLLDLHPFSLRRLEERGELVPLQKVGERRVYSRVDVERVAKERQAAKTAVRG